MDKGRVKGLEVNKAYKISVANINKEMARHNITLLNGMDITKIIYEQSVTKELSCKYQVMNEFDRDTNVTWYTSEEFEQVVGLLALFTSTPLEGYKEIT